MPKHVIITSSSDASSFSCHSAAARPREVRAAHEREDAVGLEDRVVRAERILEDALHVGGSTPSAGGPRASRCRRRRSVIGRARRAQQAEDHLADRSTCRCRSRRSARRPRRAATAKLTSLDGEQLAAAERAGAVGLASTCRARAASGRRLPAGDVVARARARRTAAPRSHCVERERAAGPEAAAGRRVEQRRRPAGDAARAAARRSARRPRAATRSAAACTGAAARRRSSRPAPSRPACPRT